MDLCLIIKNCSVFILFKVTRVWFEGVIHISLYTFEHKFILPMQSLCECLQWEKKGASTGKFWALVFLHHSVLRGRQRTNNLNFTFLSRGLNISEYYIFTQARQFRMQMEILDILRNLEKPVFKNIYPRSLLSTGSSEQKHRNRNK